MTPKPSQIHPSILLDFFVGHVLLVFLILSIEHVLSLGFPFFFMLATCQDQVEVVVSKSVLRGPIEDTDAQLLDWDCQAV